MHGRFPSPRNLSSFFLSKDAMSITVWKPFRASLHRAKTYLLQEIGPTFRQMLYKQLLKFNAAVATQFTLQYISTDLHTSFSSSSTFILNRGISKGSDCK